MNRKLNAILAAVLALVMLCSAAAAETISFNGSVSVKDTVEVYAPIGGSVDAVNYSAGEVVTANDVLVSLKTTKVYATQAGTVTGIFAQLGDSAETIASRYGAVMYLEGTSKYTISASTENAYNSADTKYVHVGETVYITARSDSSHKGTGVITSVNGTSYTVEVQSGSFEIDESCDIYRSANRTTSTRIGRGSTSRVNPVAVTGSGSIVAIAVKDGDTVERGQLLFETLDGSFDGLYMSGSDIYAGVNGVVGSISANKGGSIQKNSVVAVIYPEGSMRIEGSVSESDLAYIAVGDSVEIEMNWNADEEVLLQGTISMISAVAGGNGDSASFTVYVDFTPDAYTRYGMTCTVSTIETVAEEAEEAEEATETVEETAETTEKPSFDGMPADGSFPAGGFPEGFAPEGGFPEGGIPEGVAPTNGVNANESK